MTRQEFTDALRKRLAEDLPPAEVMSHVQYYQGYIDGELHRGKSEEEIIDELGDPLLIAKTIVESPHETDLFGDTVVEDQREAYEEGSWQGEHSPLEEESDKNPENLRDADSKEEQSGGQKAEGVSGKNAKKSEGNSEGPEGRTGGLEGKTEGPEGTKQSSERQSSERQTEGPEGTKGRTPSPGKGQQYGEQSGTTSDREHEKRSEGAERPAGETGPSDNPFKEENGEFNWGLFAVLLAAVMIIVAIIWIIGKLVTVLGPALLIILAIILIVYTIHTNAKQ